MPSTVPAFTNRNRVATPVEKQPTLWHSLEIERIRSLLESNLERGLSPARVKEQTARFGLNELTGKKGKPIWLKFLLQYKQPLLIVLLFAGLTKFITGSYLNAAVIWGVTTTNAIISFIQESKAEGAIAALSKAVTTEATVIRNAQTD